MSDATIIFLRTCILLFEIAAAFTGLLLFNKWRGTAMPYFIGYLVMIVLFELTGYYLGSHHLYEQKNRLYKYIELPFEFLAIAFFYYQLANKSFTKKLVVGAAITFLVVWILECMFFDDVKLPFSSFSYSVGNLLLLIVLFNFFARLIQSEQLLRFYASPTFWISAGLLIFYLVSFPYYLMFNFLVKHYYRSIYLPYHVIVILLNYIMYSIFIYALIWTRPR